MNSTNASLFDVYFVMLNVRSTLEFCLKKEVPTKVYQQRKEVINTSVNGQTVLRSLIDQNPNEGPQLEEKIRALLSEVYADDSTVLMPGDETVRVDHTQHIKILDELIPLMEMLKSLTFSYLTMLRRKNEADERFVKMFIYDEWLYRAEAMKIVLVDLANSIFEHQKCLKESNGEPTPQSNFILQNEIFKYQNYLQVLRSNCHMIDNKSLDRFDLVMQTMEMLQRRRELRPNMTIQDSIDKVMKELDAHIVEADKEWGAIFNPLYKEMGEFVREQQEAAKAAAQKADA